MFRQITGRTRKFTSASCAGASCMRSATARADPAASFSPQARSATTPPLPPCWRQCRPPRCCWPTEAMKPTGCAMPQPSARPRLASPQNPTGKSRYPMTGSAIESATRSKTCSPDSRTGAALPLSTIDAPTPTNQQSLSPQPSSSGCDQ